MGTYIKPEKKDQQIDLIFELYSDVNLPNQQLTNRHRMQVLVIGPSPSKALVVTDVIALYMFYAIT